LEPAANTTPPLLPHYCLCYLIPSLSQPHPLFQLMSQPQATMGGVNPCQKQLMQAKSHILAYYNINGHIVTFGSWKYCGPSYHGPSGIFLSTCDTRSLVSSSLYVCCSPCFPWFVHCSLPSSSSPPKAACDWIIAGSMTQSHILPGSPTICPLEWLISRHT
jgi:hypothetical protein